MEGKVVNFVTGNAKKFEEVKDILTAELKNLGVDDVQIRQTSIDLPELQGTAEEIVRAKLRTALESNKGPLIIEDTSLCFNYINGLPGPYIRSFLGALGCKGLWNMVKGFEDKTAYAKCIFGIGKSNNEEAHLFPGVTDGSIVSPRGDEKFGWDPVFQPAGFESTFAEMDSKTKNSISHRYRALKGLAEFLANNPSFFSN